jgi:hypothetical protein
MSLPTPKPILVRHCSVCDTYQHTDMFIEWLQILNASAKLEVPVMQRKPYIDLKHTSNARTCVGCSNGVVTQSVFEWKS